MCFKTIPVVSRPCSNITRRRQSNPANLRHISTSSTTPLLSLWLSGIVSQLSTKQTSFPLFSLQSTLSILGLTETWIVQKTQQLQLPSLTIYLSLTPHVRLAGVGALVLLISNNWKYSTHSPLCNYNSFESHAITIMAPINSRLW